MPPVPGQGQSITSDHDALWLHFRQLLPPPATLGNHQAIECKSNGPRREGKSDRTGRESARERLSLGADGFPVMLLLLLLIHSFICHFSLSLALGPKLLGSFVGAAAAATSLDHLHPCSFVSLYSFARSLASQLLASQFSSVQCSACPFFFPSFYTTFAVPCSLTHSVR